MQKRDDRARVSNGYVRLAKQADGQTPLQYMVMNISRGGLCFKSQDEYELNEVVTVNILINQESVLTGQCRVCYRNQEDSQASSTYGLSFLDHFLDHELLDRFESHSLD